MAKVQVLGTACSKCGYLFKNAEIAASQRNAGDTVGRETGEKRGQVQGEKRGQVQLLTIWGRLLELRDA